MGWVGECMRRETKASSHQQILLGWGWRPLPELKQPPAKTPAREAQEGKRTDLPPWSLSTNQVPAQTNLSPQPLTTTVGLSMRTTF